MSGRLLGFVDLGQQLGVSRLGNDAENAISDARREFVGPLVNGLVCDAQRLGCGRDGTAEKFYGF